MVKAHLGKCCGGKHNITFNIWSQTSKSKINPLQWAIMAVKSDQIIKNASPKTALMMDTKQPKPQTSSEKTPEIMEHVHNNNDNTKTATENTSTQNIANRQPESRPQPVDENKEPRVAEVKGYRCQFSPAVSAAARKFVEQRVKQHALEKERMAREWERVRLRQKERQQKGRQQQEGEEQEKEQKAKRTPARRGRKSPRKDVVVDEGKSIVSGNIEVGQMGQKDDARRRNSVDELFDYMRVELGF